MSQSNSSRVTPALPPRASGRRRSAVGTWAMAVDLPACTRCTGTPSPDCRDEQQAQAALSAAKHGHAPLRRPDFSGLRRTPEAGAAAPFGPSGGQEQTPSHRHVELAPPLFSVTMYQ